MNKIFYHLKIALRNLRSNGMYSVINIGGLAVSLAAVILIVLWVVDESGYDRFHRHADQLYHVNTEAMGNISPQTPASFLSAMEAELPEVVGGCRIKNERLNYAEYEGKRFYDEKAAVVDSSFFTTFNFPLITGNPANPFPDMQSVILAKSTAAKIFGDEDPSGKMLTFFGGRTVQVTGVMEDLPHNTSVGNYTMLLCLDRKSGDWGNMNMTTYVRLQPGTDMSAFEEKLKGIMIKNHPYGAQLEQMAKIRFWTQPLVDVHLFTADGKAKETQSVIRLFSIVAFMVLIIACINYVNLVTARAGKRNREIGMRKIAGASKIGLLGQLMSEALILFFAAGLAALVLVAGAIPVFNDLTAKSFSVNPFQPVILVIFGVSFIVIVLLAGIWPATLLSSFRPIEVFRNRPAKQNKTVLFRKALVVAQFVFSIGLIVGTLTVGRQLNYIRNMHLGYDKENVCVMSLYNMNGHFDAVKAELLQQPGITGVTRANEEITKIQAWQDAKWEGKETQEPFLMARLDVDEQYIPMMGIEMPAGENFTGTRADSTRFLVNETAVGMMGMTNPTGKRFSFRGIDGTIAGVVKDFHFNNMHEKIGAVVLSRPMTPKSYSRLYVQIDGEKTSEALAAVNRLWQRYNADYQFSYKFIDDTFDEMHRSDLRIGKLFAGFAVIAVLISCLGLFGLVTFTAETKTKEIGIRKVFGAEMPNIITMLAKEFIVLVMIAGAIAFPLSYYWLDKLLQDYAYRIDISWGIFCIAALIILSLTLFTVGWQAVKAAAANPLKSIKTE